MHVAFDNFYITYFKNCTKNEELRLQQGQNNVITSPSSVTATECIPPQVTWIKFTPSTPLIGAALLRSKISSPRPSCPTSPVPMVKMLPTFLIEVVVPSKKIVISCEYSRQISNLNHHKIIKSLSEKEWFKPNITCLSYFTWSWVTIFRVAISAKIHILTVSRVNALKGISFSIDFKEKSTGPATHL